MPANSTARRLVKYAISPLIGTAAYRYVQAGVKARDIRSGEFSEPELDLVALGLLSGETAVDVGANFGMYLPAMAQAVGPAGSVRAFEPVPSTVQALRVVVRLLRLRNVVVHPAGCADIAGTISVSVPVQRSGAPSAGQAYIADRDDDHPGKDRQVRWNSTRSMEADMVRLDDIIPVSEDVALLKCDVEGAELRVFRGASELIDRCKPTVICEINPWFLEGFGVPLGELLGFFERRGYVLYRYHDAERPRRLRPVATPRAIEEDNYVFLHPARAERFRSVVTDPR